MLSDCKKDMTIYDKQRYPPDVDFSNFLNMFGNW